MRKQLAQFDLLILDELGYVPTGKAGAELLFDVLNTAYERVSLIVTTNLPFARWTEVLGSERLTGAALHYSPGVYIPGEADAQQRVSGRSSRRQTVDSVFVGAGNGARKANDIEGANHGRSNI